MRNTLEKYWKEIEEGRVNPIFQCEEKNHGVIFDPKDEKTPLNHMGFGRWYLLDNEKETVSTGTNEYVLVPIGGVGKVTVEGGETYDLSRPGGPFKPLPEESNASALYVGRNQRFTVMGRSKMLFYFAPAFSDRPARFIQRKAKPLSDRGNLVWKRRVINLVSAGIESDNLIVGETYSPPGMWSGTPLHVHDRENNMMSESDHEEVYYFVQRLFAREDEMDPYAVQMMFDSRGLNKAYRLKHRTAVAIPGGCHPVVAGPCSDLLYVWALATDRSNSKLSMRDIRDYAFLKRIGLAVQEQIDRRGITPIPEEAFRQICANHGLASDKEKTLLKLYLKEYGFEATA